MSEPKNLVPTETSKPPKKPDKFLEVHWTLFKVGFLIFSVYELVKFFRYLFKLW